MGIAKSLHWEAARFSQRAVGEFFNGQLIPFVIDAGTAMEHLAKAIVADHAPLRLFEARYADTFTDVDRRVICGGTGPPPLWEDLGAIIERICGLHSIRAAEALTMVSEEFLAGGVDLDAARRVSAARNVAVHTGESPAWSDVNALAQDWLSVMGTLGASRHPGELWGNWANVVTPLHLTTLRSVEADADVRIRRAVNALAGFGVGHVRRSRIKLDDSNETLRCPACRNSAAVTPMRSNQFPQQVWAEDVDVASRVLDCLHCGLTLYGEQIEYASARHGVDTDAVDAAWKLPR